MHNESFPTSAYWALRIALGVGPFLAGLDKFFHVLADWNMYLSPLAERVLPIPGPAFLKVVGVVEMIVGLAVLTRFTRVGAYVAAAWLVAIAANLVSTGMFFDLAVRDLEIAVAAFALARLSELRERGQEPFRRAREERIPGHTLLHVDTGR